MSLSDMQCRAAKPKVNTYRLYDSGGLYLEVKPSGNKFWRHKYSYLGKEKSITYGPYPDISLLEAREKKDDAKKELRAGNDPLHVRYANELKARQAHAVVFRGLAKEWMNNQTHWTPRYLQAVTFRLENYAFPDLGDIPVHLITPQAMLGCLKKIDETAPATTQRIKAYCRLIFKYGIVTGKAERDPTYGLEVALKKHKKKHYASITIDEFPEFIVTLHQYQHRISRQTFLATISLLLTLVRTSELIGAKRTEFDLKRKMWVIPAERMKMGLPHMVPLSNQMVKIVVELMNMHRNSEYLFPCYFDPRKTMTNNTVLVALKRMGYKGRMTGHGFRSLALGILKEKLGYSHDVADRQLAHVPKSSIDRAYDRAQFLPQRIEMMQRYADYVDEAYLKALAEGMAKTAKTTPKTSEGDNFA